VFAYYVSLWLLTHVVSKSSNRGRHENDAGKYKLIENSAVLSVTWCPLLDLSPECHFKEKENFDFVFEMQMDKIKNFMCVLSGRHVTYSCHM
jgi:hypothetical protein